MLIQRRIHTRVISGGIDCGQRRKHGDAGTKTVFATFPARRLLGSTMSRKGNDKNNKDWKEAGDTNQDDLIGTGIVCPQCSLIAGCLRAIRSPAAIPTESNLL